MALLAVEYWQPLLIGIAIAVALFVLRENLGELVDAGRTSRDESR